MGNKLSINAWLDNAIVVLLVLMILVAAFGMAMIF